MNQQIKPTFIEPLSDFGFKKIFGSAVNKDLLITFLNVVFQGRKTILDIHECNSERIGKTKDYGKVFYDLHCIGQNGEHIIIEVQRYNQRNFLNRILYYQSILISEQGQIGKQKKWNYEISEIYTIVLMDSFPLEIENKDENYIHPLCYCSMETGRIYLEKSKIIFLELIKFTKKEPEIQGDLEKWLFALKYMSVMQKIPEQLQEPLFKKLFKIAKYSNLNRKEQEMYDRELKRKRDAQLMKDTWFEEGEIKGRAEGEIKGRDERNQEFVLLLHNYGDPIEKISKITGLSQEAINKIIKSKKG